MEGSNKLLVSGSSMLSVTRLLQRLRCPKNEQIINNQKYQIEYPSFNTFGGVDNGIKGAPSLSQSETNQIVCGLNQIQGNFRKVWMTNQLIPTNGAIVEARNRALYTNGVNATSRMSKSSKLDYDKPRPSYNTSSIYTISFYVFATSHNMDFE